MTSAWFEGRVLAPWLESVGTIDEAPIDAEGAWITTSGRRLLDAGSYGLSFFGHRHPRVIDAVHRQLDQFAWASRCLASPIAEAAASALAARFDGDPCVQFFSTGTEATDAVLRLVAARVGRSPRALTVRNNFHGLSVGALAVNGRRALRRSSAAGWDVVELDWRKVDDVIAQLADDPVDVAFFEPVQGEAGVVFPPEGELRRVCDAVRAAGGLVVLDEIQVGLGRLGVPWGKDLQALPWDGVLVGKALGGGVVPVSAVVMGPALAPIAQDHAHLLLTTFGGNPMAAAATVAALTAIEEDRLVERAAQVGTVVARAFDRAGFAELGHVVEHRGRGTLWGVELANARVTADAIRRIVAAGVLVARPVLTEKVVRLALPAIVTDDEANYAAEVVIAGIKDAHA